MDHFSYSIEKYYLTFILFENSENKATGTICLDIFYNTKICRSNPDQLIIFCVQKLPSNILKEIFLS